MLEYDEIVFLVKELKADRVEICVDQMMEMVRRLFLAKNIDYIFVLKKLSMIIDNLPLDENYWNTAFATGRDGNGNRNYKDGKYYKTLSDPKNKG